MARPPTERAAFPDGNARKLFGVVVNTHLVAEVEALRKIEERAFEAASYVLFLDEMSAEVCPVPHSLDGDVGGFDPDVMETHLVSQLMRSLQASQCRLAVSVVS